VTFRAHFERDVEIAKKSGTRFLFSDCRRCGPLLQYRVLMSLPMIDHEDFSVVVKNRASPPKPWRWEIYRAGRTSPIEHSEVFFESVAEATRAGKVALQSLLSDYPG
jgi:hypothetical protein